MGNRLYVGNLPFQTTENDLEDAFKQAGAVESVDLMQDRQTGKSRGFAFVQMGSDAEAAKAIEILHGKDFGGRVMTVNEARPREERGSGGGGWRGGGGDRGRDRR